MALPENPFPEDAQIEDYLECIFLKLLMKYSLIYILMMIGNGSQKRQFSNLKRNQKIIFEIVFLNTTWNVSSGDYINSYFLA